MGFLVPIRPIPVPTHPPCTECGARKWRATSATYKDTDAIIWTCTNTTGEDEVICSGFYVDGKPDYDQGA